MRAVTLAILLVTIVTFFAVVYSSYEDYGALLNASKTGASASNSRLVISGTTATLYLNITFANNGLLPFRAGVSCPSGQLQVSCNSPNLTLEPHGGGTLHFVMTIANYTQKVASPGGLHANGTIAFELVPFASLSLNIDFGRQLRTGGG